MKKMFVILPLAVLLLTLTIGIAGAAYGYADPVLCVSGQWLVVDAASPSAVTVFVPEDTRYGDQKAGGCKKSVKDDQGGNPPLIKIVKEWGRGHSMRVRIDGKNASTPNVTVSYGDQILTEHNKGKGTLDFRFDLQVGPE